MIDGVLQALPPLATTPIVAIATLIIGVVTLTPTIEGPVGP